MLEKIIKKTRIFGSALLLATAISCGESDYDVYEPIINSVNYNSYSSENSINHWFVTGEDINVYVGLNEGVDSIYIDAERRFRDNTVKERYDMVKDLENNYSGVIPKFDDGGVLKFKVVVNQGKRYENSSSIEEAIFIGEKDAHDFIKNWLDGRSTEFCNILYGRNEKINCDGITLETDFNLKKIEDFLSCKDTMAIIEYVGENDYYGFSLDERGCLTNNRIAHRYIYNLLYPGYYWGELSINEVTNKQNLENYVATFYSGLLY